MGDNSAVRFCECFLLMLQVLISQENCRMRNTVIQENEDVIEDDDDISPGYFEEKNSQPLSVMKKLYEFCAAPKTKFWGDVVSD
jgi:hypothetical protein